MNDKHTLNPIRIFRAVEMWLWYGRAWNVSLSHMLRFHHRPHALSLHLKARFRQEYLNDLEAE